MCSRLHFSKRALKAMFVFFVQTHCITVLFHSVLPVRLLRPHVDSHGTSARLFPISGLNNGLISPVIYQYTYRHSV